MHLGTIERPCSVCRQPTRRLVNGWPVCMRCKFRRVDVQARSYAVLLWLVMGLFAVGVIVLAWR